jgi:NAD(P)-dependent dehydrogenase (short-subunit alcohol dehydrogenase family)
MAQVFFLTGSSRGLGRQIAEADADADAAWHYLTVSTDRHDATAADRDPLGVASS